jgi:hypothetical protein
MPRANTAAAPSAGAASVIARHMHHKPNGMFEFMTFLMHIYFFVK